MLSPILTSDPRTLNPAPFPMAHAYSIGRLFGIPLRVHPTLLLFLGLAALSNALAAGWLGMLVGLAYAAGVFASIALHEVGHSLVARAKGARILEILLLPIGGMARLAAMPRRPADEIQIALAGPAVSLALGLAGLLAAPLLRPVAPLPAALLHELGRLNLVLVLFNLIPSFPMDGGRVFRAALVPRLGRLRATRLAARLGRACAWLFGLWALWPLLHRGHVNFILLLIAFFIHQSATAEARQAEREALADLPSGADPGLFDDLLRKWR